MADTFWQALSNTIQRAVNLRVVTLVGDAQVQGNLEALRISAPATTSASLVTDINVIGGDITTILSDKLLGQDYAGLRELHAASVTQAQEIIARNVTILVTIAKEIGNQLESLPPPSAGPNRSGPGNAP